MEGFESSSRSPPFLFIAKKRDGAVQQRGLMSRFSSVLKTFPNEGKRGRILDSCGFFLHRLTGVRELRKRVRPSRAVYFFAPIMRGTRGTLVLRSSRAGSFSLNLSGECAVCGRRETAASAAGTKRKGHLRFPFLFELLPFPC